MFEIICQANRTTDWTIAIKTASGGYLQLAATDVVRVKVSRAGTTILDLDSVAASSNGSSVTVDELGDGSTTYASVTLRLAQGDTASLQGTYDVEVAVVDDSETTPADAIKTAERGVLHIVPSGDGDVGKT